MPKSIYRRAKFVEILHEIRQEMAHEADYDVDLFAELARTGNPAVTSAKRKKLSVQSDVLSLETEADPLRFDRSAKEN
jgi:hypothetical protein